MPHTEFSSFSRRLPVSFNENVSVSSHVANVRSVQDYYPFGMHMPGRSFVSGEGHRYGFNGQEKDNEIKGKGNSLNYTFRVYDPRIGRFFAVDPIAAEYPELTPFQHSSLNPIWMIEVEGLEGDPFQNRMEGGIGVRFTILDGNNPIKNTFKNAQYTLGLKLNPSPENSNIYSRNNISPNMAISTTWGRSGHVETVVKGEMKSSPTQDGNSLGSISASGIGSISKKGSGFGISGSVKEQSTKSSVQKDAEKLEANAKPLSSKVDKAFLLFNEDGVSFALSRKKGASNKFVLGDVFVQGAEMTGDLAKDIMSVKLGSRLPKNEENTSSSPMNPRNHQVGPIQEDGTF